MIRDDQAESPVSFTDLPCHAEGEHGIVGVKTATKYRASAINVSAWSPTVKVMPVLSQAFSIDALTSLRVRVPSMPKPY